MRICPVCPVMEIIVPVDVTDVELVASKVRFALDRVNYERLCVRSLERFERFK